MTSDSDPEWWPRATTTIPNYASAGLKLGASIQPIDKAALLGNFSRIDTTQLLSSIATIDTRKITMGALAGIDTTALLSNFSGIDTRKITMGALAGVDTTRLLGKTSIASLVEQITGQFGLKNQQILSAAAQSWRTTPWVTDAALRAAGTLGMAGSMWEAQVRSSLAPPARTDDLDAELATLREQAPDLYAAVDQALDDTGVAPGKAFIVRKVALWMIMLALLTAVALTSIAVLEVVPEPYSSWLQIVVGPVSVREAYPTVRRVAQEKVDTIWPGGSDRADR